MAWEEWMSEPGDKPALDAQGRLADDRACISCGYSLKGLDPSGVCPECAMLVRCSFDGAALQYASPHYLDAVSTGARYAQSGIGLMIAAAVIGGLLSMDVPWRTLAYFLGVPYLGGAVFSIVGWWAICSVDQRVQVTKRGTRLRRYVRILLALWTGCFAVSWAPFISAPMTKLACSAMGALAFALWFFAAMRYVRILADRASSSLLRLRARRCTRLALALAGCYLVIAVLTAQLIADARGRAASNVAAGIDSVVLGGAGVACAGIVTMPLGIAIAITYWSLCVELRDRMEGAIVLSRAMHLAK